uniref:CSON001170 protein n=1 Tax=Culicoides sonorensis TaxID=179676 RepID=A0A336LQW3_CULSO
MPPKKAQKDALLLFFDCGPDSNVTTSKDGETFFSRAKKCIMQIYQKKIFENSNDELGLVIMGGDTQNRMHQKILAENSESTYQNLTEVLEMKIPTWDAVRFIEREIELCEDHRADWIEAILLGLDILHDMSMSRFYQKMKIILLTTFASPISYDREQIDELINGINEKGVDLIVINDNIEYNGDFTHDPPHFSQPIDKTQTQDSSEKLIEEIVDQTKGYLCNIENAELHLVYFEKKKVKGRPNPYTFKIGSKISMDVVEYVKVTETKFLDPWKSINTTTGDDVERKIKYFQNDKEIKTAGAVGAEHETSPDFIGANFLLDSSDRPLQNAQMEVDEPVHNTITGYMYGSTPVPYEPTISQSFGEKCLDCINFSERKYMLSEYFTGKGCHVILPKLTSKSSIKKFATIVRALYESNYVIIARKMYNKHSSPKIVALIPEYTDDHDDPKPFLTMIGLHFYEDCVDIKFPSLKNTKKNKPSDDQLQLMEDLINSMDLMTAGDEKSGNSEAFSLNKTLNPVNQHVCRMIAQRALRPNEPLQEISEELAKLIDVPDKIKAQSKDILLKAKDSFELQEITLPTRMEKLQAQLKKIEEKYPDNNSNQNNDQNLPVDSQLNHVTTANPGEEFLFLIDRGILIFDAAAQQLRDILHNLTFKSFDPLRLKILKGIVSYRYKAIEVNPQSYNEFIKNYKNELLSKGMHDFFTEMIVNEGNGLILSSESNLCDVTLEAGEEFLKSIPIATDVPLIQAPDEDDSELMNLLE